MRKIKALITALVWFTNIPTWAGLPPTTTKGSGDSANSTTFNFQFPDVSISRSGTTSTMRVGPAMYQPGINLVSNNSFETDVTGWTASAGAFARETAAANITQPGVASASWATASARTLTSSSVTIASGNGIAGRNGVVSCSFKGGTGAISHTLAAFDGTNTISSASFTSTTGFSRSSVNFIFPSSGTVAVRITGGGTETLYIDDCYMGLAENFNISQVSQASFFGSTRISGMSANWSVSGTGVQDFPAIASATYTVAGNALSPTTNIPAIRFTNLPPGTYQIIARASMTQGASAGQCYYRLWDGSSYIGTDMLTTAANQDNPGPLTGSVTYSTTQSDITFRIRMRDQSLANNCLIRSSAWNDLQVEFQVYRFPSSSELAVSANIPGAPTVQTFTSGSGTYTRPNGVKYIRVRMVGGGGGGAGFGSPGANGAAGGTSTFGSTLISCTGGSGGLGGGQAGSAGAGGTCTITSPAYGTAIAGGRGTSGGLEVSVANTGGAGGNSFFGGGGGGATNSGGTAAASNSGSGGGGAAGGGGGYAGGGGSAGGYSEVFIANPSPTYAYSVGAAGTAGGTGGSGGAGYIEVTEFYGVLDVPILVGSVTSSSAGAERVERVSIASNCTVSHQSGTWISSVTGTGSGSGCTINFTSGQFSSNSISCVSNSIAAVDSVCNISTSPTSSSTVVRCRNKTPADTDVAFSLLCMGPR